MILKILNQSELNSQSGPTWKATKRKVGRKIILEAETPIIAFGVKSHLGRAANLRPTVSKMLKIVPFKRKNQEI